MTGGKSTSTAVGKKGLYYCDFKKTWLDCTVDGTNKDGSMRVCNSFGRVTDIAQDKLASHLIVPPAVEQKDASPSHAKDKEASGHKDPKDGKSDSKGKAKTSSVFGDPMLDLALSSMSSACVTCCRTSSPSRDIHSARSNNSSTATVENDKPSVPTFGHSQILSPRSETPTSSPSKSAKGGADKGKSSKAGHEDKADKTHASTEMAIGESALYYSDNKKEWFECTVLGHDTDGGTQVRLDGTQHSYIRTVPKELVGSHLRVNNDKPSERALYYSDNKRGWFECVCLGPDAEGNMLVNVDGNARMVLKQNVSTHLIVWTVGAAEKKHKPGETALYFSDNKQSWFECSVLGKDENGATRLKVDDQVRTLSKEKVTTHLILWGKDQDKVSVDNASTKTESKDKDHKDHKDKDNKDKDHKDKDHKDHQKASSYIPTSLPSVTLAGSSSAAPSFVANPLSMSATPSFVSKPPSAQGYRLGQRAAYKSDRQGGSFFQCIVIGQDALGGVQVNVNGNVRTLPAEKLATHLRPLD